MNAYKEKWLGGLAFALCTVIAMPGWAACPEPVDTTLTGLPGLGLALTTAVDKSSARPGDVLLYALSFCNASDAAISGLKIDNATPASTDFVSASCGELPPDVACTVSAQPAPGAGGTIVWTLTGALPPGASGIVHFQVSVR